MPATLQRLPAPPSPRESQAAAPDVRTLIDQLLAEQNKLQTPVARFAEIHDQLPDLEPHYRSLIPLTKPGSGEQYAFEVSLDRCTGCKACVSACHSLNGLDDEEVWRDTGLLLGGASSPGWQQTITTACHHCEDPGCMNGCPVGAYEKDAQTGIVRHLDDQCIGCSYCILKCPYDVPKYSKKRGIVRKCDMCHQRLAEGEAPACVQACPTEAIRIVKVETKLSTATSSLFPSKEHSAQSAIPSSSITLPTTRYVGREVPATAFAADRSALIPQHAHWPLVFMLVFTQAGIGLLIGNSTPAVILTGSAIFFIGMAAAFSHLGQPLKAWRFFLGLKTSWLSREILAFSLFAPMPLMLCAIVFSPDFPFKQTLGILLDYSVLPLGLIAVFTSVMIYHDTHRALWKFSRSSTRFFGTVAAFAALCNGFSHSNPILTGLIFSGVVICKLIPELLFLRKRDDSAAWSPDRHSAMLQLGPLRKILLGRIVLALVSITLSFINPWLAIPVLILAELLERQLYFQAVQAPKMPGNFASR
ncbi:MAG: dimethyl sulfoxide reductase anchor subunit [Gloeobacteraceae cyanobacterium ES-bin-144]|nr:dimethyl sulfoxide reductase anchor subunit [Verrucomicrobiales bacterium]